jgi:ribonuclease HIII
LKRSPPFTRSEGELLPRAVVGQWGEDSLVGPVVVVALRLDAQSLAALSRLELAGWDTEGVRCSNAARLAATVVPYESVVLKPRRWNTLVNKLSNRDRVLDWAYRRALTGILSLHPDCRAATYDARSPAFAVLESELPGKPVPIVYRSIHEDDPSLAVASLLARAAFARTVVSLGHWAGVEVPLPPGDPEAALRRIRDERGVEGFLHVAKRDDPRARALLEAPRD